MICIFDLDDTLYVSKELRGLRKQSMLKAIAEKKMISFEDADALCEKLKKGGLNWQEVFKTLDMQKEDFWKSFNVDYTVPFNSKVHACLERLAKKHQLVILTNSPKKAALKVLDDLGILRFFSKVYCAEDIAEPKPSSCGFQQIMNELKAAPENCIAFGSSLTKDLAPASLLGIKAVLLSPENIHAALWRTPIKATRNLEPHFRHNLKLR